MANGGFRGSPASLAALKRHRFTWADAKHCVCGRVAVAGRSSCYVHGGGRGRPITPGRAARRELDAMARQGAIPAAIEGLAIYQALRAKPGLSCEPIALELVRAWFERNTDGARWVRAVRQAREAGKDHG